MDSIVSELAVEDTNQVQQLNVADREIIPSK
jgi:hypothetical protein